MMKRASFILLFALSFVGLPPGVFALEEIGPSTNPNAAEIQRLRNEVDVLRQRIDQLQRPPPPGRAGDEDERSRLLAETRQILADYRAGKTAAWKQTHARIRELRREVANALGQMQADYTRRAQLDEAVAIRDAIRCLKDIGRRVQADPGRLLTVGAVGEILFFRVTGANSGSLYGTGVYTSDSSLATAAVHAGVLKLGQTGIVKVTTIPSHPQFPGSTQNGITSSSWSSHPGFRAEALDDEDLDLAECEPPSAAALAIPDGISPTPPPAICAPPKPVPAEEDPAGHTAKGSESASVVWPAGLPAEAREQLEGHLAMVAELRKTTREKVARLAADSVNRLQPIQDAHTRAARLDEAIGVRDLIRQLTP